MLFLAHPKVLGYLPPHELTYQPLPADIEELVQGHVQLLLPAEEPADQQYAQSQVCRSHCSLVINANLREW